MPTLSSVGASLAPPCCRFHTPLIEPDVRIRCIRLSEKTHAIAETSAHDAVCNFGKTTREWSGLSPISLSVVAAGASFSYVLGYTQPSFLEDLKSGKRNFFLDCRIETQRFRSCIDCVQRVTRRSKAQYSGYVPIRFVPNEKLSRHDKLLLAFDALTLGEALGSAPPFGKIIHGAQNRIAKITVATLFPIVRSVITEIPFQAETHHAPQLILNKHCADCEFNSRCRQAALEKGELSHSQRFRRC